MNINPHHLHSDLGQMAHLSVSLCSTLRPSLYASRLIDSACRACPSRTRKVARRDSRRIHTVQAADRQCISTEQAPGAVGPYSQAVKTGNMLFVSGQVGLIPGTKDFAGGDDVEAQTEQVMLNLGAILNAGGSSFASVVKTTVLLADMGDFQKVNAIYGKYFPEGPPARACFAVRTLPLNAKVEIEAVAIA